MNELLDSLLDQLSSVLDRSLAATAFASYAEMHGRYITGQWRPSEVDGGRFCEAVHRCLYQLDTGTSTYSKPLGEIRTYLLNDTAPHKLRNKDRRHFVPILALVHEFRSDRDVVHISDYYNANQMDSMLVLHACKWMLGELLRLAWNRDTKVIAELISHVIQLDSPIIHELDGRAMVMSTALSAPEEVLVLLSHAPAKRLSIAELRAQATNVKASAISVAISRLRDIRQVRDTDDRKIAITPIGEKRVMEEILSKLSH